MMERTTMPTWRVSRHRRTAKVVPRAKRASVNLHMTKTMLTMSGRHHRRKAEAFLLTKKRKSSKKRKTRSNDPFEKGPCLDRSPGPTREVSCARMMEPEISHYCPLVWIIFGKDVDCTNSRRRSYDAQCTAYSREPSCFGHNPYENDHDVYG
jgi:hypothetical protein